MRYSALLFALAGLASSSIPSLAADVSIDATASKMLNVELRSSDDMLLVDVFNPSDQAIKVSKRFLYGPEIGWADLAFDVRNGRGEVFSFVAKETGEPPADLDWCILLPHQFVGAAISLDTFRGLYALKGGRYSVSAEYLVRSENGDLLEKLKSASIQITIAQ